jgi:2-octaprenylphenol hydroxylase
MTAQYDVVINGAGIPGLALALLLTRESRQNKPRILLLDRQPLIINDSVHETPQSVDDFDLRVFALTEASRRLLQAAGAWPAEMADRIYPYEQMHVWDAGGSGQIHFDAADLGVASLGYIVEGRVLQDWLVRKALQENSIETSVGDEIADFECQAKGLKITLQSGAILNTQLLVGADGANSRVRQLSGIDTVGWSYQQQAVVAAVETENDHCNTAWQRFLPEGPLAFLPMQKPWSSIVWSVSQPRADYLCDLNEEEFLRLLAEDFQHRLGAVKAVGQRAKFPLRMSHAQSYIDPRVALVADAAHTVHPLAGQGLNLGLLDVSALAEQLKLAWFNGRDIGSRRVLRAYERARKGDNWLMQSSFGGLKRLFSNEQVLLTQLRNTGLNVIDRVPAVKNAFVRKAMGL